jgi:hypothetical protein
VGRDLARSEARQPRIGRIDSIVLVHQFLIRGLEARLLEAEARGAARRRSISVFGSDSPTGGITASARRSQ